jgi:D-3-phosphoglycerate dehydrogenase
MAHRGWRDKELKAHLLSQARLGILGLGRIGKRVFSLAKAFGAKVEYYDPFVKLTDEERISFGDSVNHLETLLSRSELVSLHLPLTPLTHKLVGTSFLANCNPNGLILINTSRGSVIDEPALKKILDDRESYPSKLELVALDVFPEEPLPPNSWFRTHPKVIATPHIGAFTKEAEEASSLEATEIAIKFFQSLSLHASKTSKKEGLEDLEPVPWFGNLPLKEAWFVEAFGEQHQKLLGF